MRNTFCYVGPANQAITRKAIRLMCGGDAIAIVNKKNIKQHDIKGDVLLVNLGADDDRIIEVTNMLYTGGASFVYEIIPGVGYKVRP